MATVLISFIGTGKLENLEYEKIDYFFDGETVPRSTTVFGSALIKYLKTKNENVERWLIMGTEKSIWSELIKMFPKLDLNNEERKIEEFLFEQSCYAHNNDDYISEITQENLNKWQDVISNNLSGTKAICRLVGDATNAESQEKIFQSLLDVIEENDKVVFDVTHGLRNQPIITSFATMYLRYLKNVTNVEFYYGAKDLKGKVVKLDFCRELLEATEAFSTFKQTGNFVKIGKCLSLNENDIEMVVFSNEMNQPDKGTASKLLQELENKSGNPSSIENSLQPLIKDALDWQKKSNLALVYQSRAETAFEHRQYFQAIALLWEALRTAGQRKYPVKDFDPNSHHGRKEAEEKIRENLPHYEGEIFQIIGYLRNAVMHGTDPETSRVEQKVRKARSDTECFRGIFKEGQKILAKLLT